MGYKPYERRKDVKSNYHNGLHIKNFKMTNDDITVTISEDRNSIFYNSIVNEQQTRSEELIAPLLELFKLGLSNKEVVNFMNRVYGNSYSPQNISNITEVIIEIVDGFKNIFLLSNIELIRK